MEIRQIVFTGLVLGLAAAAFAGDEAKMKMSVVVIDDSADGEVRIELDSDDLGFDLHSMQEGESQSVVDKSGRTILISRSADSFTIDVDGKTIDLPVLDGEHHGAMWIGDGSDVDCIGRYLLTDLTLRCGILDEKTVDRIIGRLF